jgi:hypothetical protein
MSARVHATLASCMQRACNRVALHQYTTCVSDVLRCEGLGRRDVKERKNVDRVSPLR